MDERFQMGFETTTLESLKVAARAELSGQLAHDLEARVFQDAMSYMRDTLIFEIRTRVYADRVGHDEVVVPFSKTSEHAPVRMTIPARRRMAIPHAAGAVVCALLALVLALPVVALACVPFVALAALAWRENAPYVFTFEQAKTHVAGEVKFAADYFNTFPDNNTVYPDSLGGVVRIVQPSSPSVTYYRTDDLRGDADR